MQQAEDTVEDASGNKHQKIYQKLLKWRPPEDIHDEIESFDVEQAWSALFSIASCQQIMIKTSIQKRLDLVVGVNVTQEFPWKQIPFRTLRSQLFDSLPKGQFFHAAFEGYKSDSPVLLGYAPIITQNLEHPPEGDPFILFINSEDTKLALGIIRNMEIYERLIYNKKLYKKPKLWRSLGSENDVVIDEVYDEPVDVEIQSVYPVIKPSGNVCSVRLSTDVRDGYVELVPPDGAKFDILTRKRMTIGIQKGDKMITVDQQTDPPFPSNAWAQYLYEINEDDQGLDPDSEEEEAKGKAHQQQGKPEKKPLEVSDEIKFLLEQLEFNQIDMYRNDYKYLTNVCVLKNTLPELKEILCFANILKSYQRFVCCCDWYPTLAGLIVTSYTFSTPCTIDSVYKRTDYVQQAVLQPNPILMWSFNDNLNYKLEFESPREITAISFCPHDANILIGGASNGQIILWDLQDRGEKLDYQEALSTAQMKYRVMMGEFLKWAIQVDEDIIVAPAIISPLESSQKNAITSIHWIDKNFFINSYGKVYKNPNTKMTYRYFVSSSMDGSIAFWNLDATQSKKNQSTGRKDLPKALTQSQSIYKGKILKPVFTVVFNEPITAIMGDTSVFRYVKEKPKNMQSNSYNYPIKMQAIKCNEVRQSMVISTFYGHIERIDWQGLSSDTDNKEIVLHPLHFAHVHDGPIVSMKKNPFFPKVFVTIGRNIFAIWDESYNYSPILWRRRQCDLTAVAWSESCPNILYITRIDGGLEAWNILERADDAYLSDVLGGGIITTISEHRPNEPEKLMGIGDYNSSLRMIKLQKSLYIDSISNHERMSEYISKEVSRKKDIQAMEQKYYENNKEFIESKRQAALEAHLEMERLEKEQQMLNAMRNKETEEPPQAETGKLSYTERMKRQWYQLNLRRLMHVLMTRKQVDEKKLEQDTALERERLSYEAAKRKALVDVIQNIGNELAAVRTQIYPEEIPDLQRSDMISNSISKILEATDSYEEIEAEAKEIFEGYEAFKRIDYVEFWERGEKRRMNLNKSLGGNTERLLWYDKMLHDNELSECFWIWGCTLNELFISSEDDMKMDQNILEEEHEQTEFMEDEQNENEGQNTDFMNL